MAEQDNMCSICLENMNDSDEILILKSCMHSFHTTCILRWLGDYDVGSCPLCRTAFWVTEHNPFEPNIEINSSESLPPTPPRSPPPSPSSSPVPTPPRSPDLFGGPYWDDLD